MKIEKTSFGQVDGQQVDLFTLGNENGMIVKITNYGGIVTSIIIPDKEGYKENIVCGFDTLEGYFSDAYRANAPYFGCIVGRYAGFIKNARITVHGRDIQLTSNVEPHQLHGGINAFDKQIWKATILEKKDSVGLKLSRISPDGENGYPGNLSVTVTYSLDNQNALSVTYAAHTDKSTPLSLTNHSYFNLNGFKDKILNHKATIYADKTLLSDESGIPDGREFMVAGTPWDYNLPKPIGDIFKEKKTGFENYYIFSKPLNTLSEVAVFTEEKSGRKLSVSSSEPGMLFYSGVYTSDELAREDGTQFGQFKAFCCETSKFINGPNIKNAVDCILNPGEEYKSTTVFKFNWD